MCKQTVLLSLGSNMGDRNYYLSAAVEVIEQEVGKILFVTAVVESEAWGFEAPPFLNQLLVVETPLLPIPLLDLLQDIERRLGRKEKTEIIAEKVVYHNRTIDIDILDYHNITYHDTRLTLPHRHLHDRDYLHPLLQNIKSFGYSI
ncbi:MAG: 2-amino-4-hydroxy-6-hydroxymethyldihydropteridine diphosphokinase [Bacteroidales bacterium]|jgi:2-amino-4-hydroxy-6-hydroxymethyldihydropteridine diphosphokinase|nr:2-amino-4-hydroxy-6-hydroxymethyldihydropteridine diphosphokinase [Bacteroidales bacterium]